MTEGDFLKRYGKENNHPMLTDRPHKNFEGSPLGRYEGDRERAKLNGYDLNDYKWLDSQAKCAS